MNGRPSAGLTLYHLTEDPLDYPVHEREVFKQGQMNLLPEEYLQIYDGHEVPLLDKHEGREHPDLPDSVSRFLRNI